MKKNTRNYRKMEDPIRHGQMLFKMWGNSEHGKTSALAPYLRILPRHSTEQFYLNWWSQKSNDIIHCTARKHWLIFSRIFFHRLHFSFFFCEQTWQSFVYVLRHTWVALRTPIIRFMLWHCELETWNAFGGDNAHGDTGTFSSISNTKRGYAYILQSCKVFCCFKFKVKKFAIQYDVKWNCKPSSTAVRMFMCLIIKQPQHGGFWTCMLQWIPDICWEQPTKSINARVSACWIPVPRSLAKYGSTVKLGERIVKLGGRILQFELWNLEVGLWNLQDGLWNWYCEMWKSYFETVKWNCEILKTGCETLGRLWNSEDKLWSSGERLWNKENKSWNAKVGLWQSMQEKLFWGRIQPKYIYSMM